MISAYFFNFYFNATFSLLAGILIVNLALGIFKVQRDSWRLFFLSLPFVKVVYDISKGIPETSILKMNIDPYTVKPGMQTISLGMDAGTFGPTLNMLFTVRTEDGNSYTASVSDYLYFWLLRRGGSNIIQTVVFILLGVSTWFIARRVFSAIQFERKRRADRRTAQSFRITKMDFRTVDIYISKAFSGTPFTGGVIKPYICLPSDALELLSPQEVEAVIAHELGHVQKFDLLFNVLIQFLGDIFWFIPFYRTLSRKIDHLREIIADQFAVKKGQSGAVLASALLKLKEIPDKSDKFILYSAFFREKSLLKTRIETLLNDNPKKSRWGWSWAPVRIVIFAFVAAAVMNSTLAGNHRDVMGKVGELPAWANTILEAVGVEVFKAKSK